MPTTSSRCDPPLDDAALAAALHSGSSVFFIRSASATRSADITSIERCAIEAATGSRPMRPVVYFVANLDCGAAPSLSSLISEAENLWVVRLDFATLFAPYPELSTWYASYAWAVPDVRTRGAHLADAARLALLHAYGGVYMDSDELLLHTSSLERIGSRAVGMEESWVLNNAFLAFPAGHPFVGAAISDFVMRFNANFWGWNGPRLVTRVWAALSAGGSNAVNVSILPPSALYPLHWKDVDSLFHPLRDATALTAEALCHAQAMHLWNHMLGSRLEAIAACGPDADTFADTLLGGVMASSCPRTIGKLRKSCSLPPLALWASGTPTWASGMCVREDFAIASAVLQPLLNPRLAPLSADGATITAWVRGPAPVHAAAAVSTQSLSLVFDCDVNCRVALAFDGSNVLRSLPLVPGRWHFVALSYTGSRFSLFVDGLQQLQEAVAVSGSVGSFDGKLSDATVQLTSDELFVDLSALVNAGAVFSAAAAPTCLSLGALAIEHNAQRATFQPPTLAVPLSSDVTVSQAEADIIGLVHPDWTGVLHAHQRVPQFFGKTIAIRSLAFEPDTSLLLARLNAMPKLRELVVNGVLDGTATFAERLHAMRPDIDIAVVVHSAPSSPQHFVEAEQLANVLRAAQARADGSPTAITRIGFVKFGMAALIRTLGVCTYDLANFPPTMEERAAAASEPAPVTLAIDAAGAQAVHVLIPGTGGDYKNQAAQILAACVLSNVVVHLIEAPSTAYLRACPAPVIVHGKLSGPAFAALLSRMDVVSYVSLSECSPGVVLESLAAGVPCLSGPHSPIFTPDEALAQLLVVNATDDPAAISAALGNIVKLVRDESAVVAMRERLLGLADSAAALADATWSAFLNGRQASESCPAAGSGGAFIRLETAADAVGDDAVDKWSGRKALARIQSIARNLETSTSFSSSPSFSVSPSFSFSPSPVETPSSSATPISAGYTVSTISLLTSGVSCADASSSATLAALLDTFIASPQFSGIPSTWITNSAQCGPNTRRLAQAPRRLQTTPSPSVTPAPAGSVIFTFTISTPNNAPPSLIAAAAAAVSAASGTNATIFTLYLQAILPGAVVTNVATNVNGYVCGTSTTPSCSSFFPASNPGTTLNIGAIIGGVIGGVAALAIFIALVVAFQLGYCGSRKAGTGAGLAVGAPSTAPATVPQHVSAASAYKPASV